MRTIRLVYLKYRNEFLLWAQVTHSIDYNQGILVFRKAVLALDSASISTDNEFKKELFSLAESYLQHENLCVLQEEMPSISEDLRVMLDELDMTLNFELKQQLEEVEEEQMKPQVWKLLILLSLALVLVLLLIRAMN